MIAPRSAFEALRRLKLRTDPRWRPAPLPRTQGATPARVAVVGAGIAGLAAATLLRGLGHHVTVLEAQDRAGGRILTLRHFDDGLFAEAGALRIADNHLLTHLWARRLGLRLEPVYPARGRLMGEDETGASLYENARWMSAHRLHHILTGHTPLEQSPVRPARAWRMVRETIKRPTWSRIAGGMDRLPHAMAQGLASDIQYNSPVHGVTQRDGHVRIDYASAGRDRTERFDHIVMAVPHTTMAAIRFEPALAPDKRRVAEMVPNADAIRFFFQLRDRGCIPDSACGYGITREGMEVWQPCFGRRDGRSLLVLAAQGSAAAPFAGLDPTTRAEYARQKAQALFPGIAERIERTEQVCWREHTWARGAQTLVDQAGFERNALGAAEGRVHFAGEYTASDGWIDGALQSAHRAADEIEHAAASARHGDHRPAPDAAEPELGAYSGKRA